MTGRVVVLTGAAALIAAACAACGSTPSTTPSASATTTAVDPCTVGTWKAASITGSVTDASGNAISLTGGAGGVLTINADGTLQVDDTAAQPDTGTAADGTVYSISTAGRGGGRVQTSGGQITVMLDSTAAITQTVSRNGTPVTSQTPNPTATNRYQCSRGRSLVITTAGGIVSTYVPAG